MRVTLQPVQLPVAAVLGTSPYSTLFLLLNMLTTKIIQQRLLPL